MAQQYKGITIYSPEQKECLDHLIYTEDLLFPIDLAPPENFNKYVTNCSHRKVDDKEWTVIKKTKNKEYSILVQIVDYKTQGDYTPDYNRYIIKWNPATRKVKICDKRERKMLPVVIKEFFSPYYQVQSRTKRVNLAITKLSSNYLDAMVITPDNTYHWYFNKWYSFITNYDGEVGKLSYCVRDRGIYYRVTVKYEDLDNPLRQNVIFSFNWYNDNSIIIRKAEFYGFNYGRHERLPHQIIEYLLEEKLFINEMDVNYMVNWQQEASLPNRLDDVTSRALIPDLVAMVAEYI